MRRLIGLRKHAGGRLHKDLVSCQVGGFAGEIGVLNAALRAGNVFQRDIHAFLDDPKKRIAEVRLYHQGYAEWGAAYEFPEKSLAGLSIDWTTNTAILPPNLDANEKSIIDHILHIPPTPAPWLAEFRKRWFGRILDRYKGSRTRIVFLRLARGPIPRPAHPPQPSTIREFAKRPNVLLYPEHAFEFIEHPENFRDGVHLNRQGSRLFSIAMAKGMRDLLGPPRPGTGQ